MPSPRTQSQPCGPASSQPYSPAVAPALVAEAAFWLLLARAALLLLSFDHIARRLGRLHAPAAALDPAILGDETSLAVRRAIQRAASLLPFNLVCMPRALAAWQMLRRRQIHAQLHFGALPRYVSEPLVTHVWLNAGPVEVTGYPLAPNLVELGYFAPPANVFR